MQFNNDDNEYFDSNNNNDNQDNIEETTEVGSDDLLADDALRLPESANILVRLHAVRAWLSSRIREANIAIGDAALILREAMQEPEQSLARPRRREREANSQMLRVQRAQESITMATQRLNTYEEAQTLLEETVSHVTAGERILVEYYLAIEQLLEESLNSIDRNIEEQQARRDVLADVLHRIEHVGIPDEEE
ncbi:MAG TPA: hypothetical protein DHW02_18870 [Ktedonobacter sp.]|nr:hypothetical protein [Ktedonobacter sp.]